MPKLRRPFVIFNPASGRGSGAKRQGPYLELLQEYFPDVKHAVTTRPGEESELAARALSDADVNLIVAVGGDGTWGNVADRILKSDRDDVAFGMLAAGTGNDFGRNFGLAQKSLDDAVRALADGRETAVDVGRMTTPAVHLASGERAESRHFLNLIGCGFDVAVIKAAADARFLRGEVLYKVTALQQLFRFAGFDFELESSGPTITGAHLMLTISNGPVFGGGIVIAPAAELNDGLLDACAIGDASALGRMKLFSLAETGRHVEHARVSTRQSTNYVVRFAAPPTIEIDGDLWKAEAPELTIEAVPGGLLVVG
jgi:diacylglycerol kinase (ATP)